MKCPPSRAAGILVATALLVACGRGEAPREAPRPVLVEQPAGDPDAALGAYAGEVRALEESPLAFRLGGHLVRRHVDAGASVRRGQLLAELDRGDQRLQVQAAEAQLAAAAAELGRVSAERARFAALAEDQLVSRSALEAQETAWKAAEEQVRAARAQLDVARNQAAYSQLRAPRDGVVASRHAEAGQVVAAGQTIFTLAGDAGREVAIALSEARIRGFSVGQPAEVELWSSPGRRLPGHIREIAAAADPATRTFHARVALDGDAAAAVELGESARVYIREDGGARAALSVPLSALQRGPSGEHAVWVVDPATRTLKAVPVEVGALGESRAPVLSGLDAGDWVVSAGGHLLREGQQVMPVDRDNRPVGPASPAPSARQAP